MFKTKIMKTVTCLLMLVFLGYESKGQFYFNDILANEQSNKLYTLLKYQKVKKISVKNFNADNQSSEGFALEQAFDDNWNTMTTTSSTIAGNASTLITTYKNNRVAATQETNKGISIKSKYEYDEKGRLLSIASVTTDTAYKYQASEKHIWVYTNDRPSIMYKIKNGADTTIIELVKDDKNNIAEEHWKYKGKELEVYYYYYNDQNKLTDVVRFNQRAKRLLPDFTFEYNDTGNLTQMTQIPANSSNYMVWQYRYNPNGLKQSELCYNKQKELVGRVEYIYLQ